MKKKFKIVVLLAFSLLAFTACTKEFCSQNDLNAIETSLNTPENNAIWRQDAIDSGLVDEGLISEYVQTQLDTAIEEYPKACLAIDPVEDQNGVTIEGKDWSYAFSLGLIEGLLVYPISYMLTFFTSLFGANGWGQIGAIVLVTIIIRSLVLLLTLKSSMQSQKMQNIQPQISEIQNKIRETTDQNEKQALSMKMMDVYKKNGINPFSSLIMPFISLPIFIGVWGAVRDTVVLRNGEIFGVNLGTTMNSQILDFNVLAIVLFLMMAAAQFCAMKIPTWIAKKKDNNKKGAMNQMSMISNVMFIMILVAGFALPAAMVLYWMVGAIFSIGQTFLLRYINKKIQEKHFNPLKKVEIIK